MAISVSSVLKGFVTLLFYYGFYYVMKPFLDNFSLTHSNAFDVFMVIVIPFIILIVILIGVFTNPDESRSIRY